MSFSSHYITVLIFKYVFIRINLKCDVTGQHLFIVRFMFSNYLIIRCNGKRLSLVCSHGNNKVFTIIIIITTCFFLKCIIHFWNSLKQTFCQHHKNYANGRQHSKHITWFRGLFFSLVPNSSDWLSIESDIKTSMKASERGMQIKDLQKELTIL